MVFSVELALSTISITDAPLTEDACIEMQLATLRLKCSDVGMINSICETGDFEALT